MQLQLLTAATATNSAPTTAAAGSSLHLGSNPGRPNEGFSLSTLDDCVLLMKSTAGSGTMTVTLKLWGYCASPTAAWHPLGTHTVDASRGLLNEATAIGEVTADALSFSQVITGLRHFDRVYLEITAIGGTSTAVSAWLVARS